MSARPDSDSPVLNKSNNTIEGGLKFGLLGQYSRYQHVTYSQNLVCLVSQSMIIDVLAYRWQDPISNSYSQHKSVNDQPDSLDICK